jgi:hypothetical protein
MPVPSRLPFALASNPPTQTEWSFYSPHKARQLEPFRVFIVKGDLKQGFDIITQHSGPMKVISLTCTYVRSNHQIPGPIAQSARWLRLNDQLPKMWGKVAGYKPRIPEVTCQPYNPSRMEILPVTWLASNVDLSIPSKNLDLPWPSSSNVTKINYRCKHI